MSVKIRLTRRGTKKKAFFRVIATDTRNPRDGRFLEILGTYDPVSKPVQINLRGDRIQHWLDHGALPSKTVAELIERSKVLTEQPAEG